MGYPAITNRLKLKPLFILCLQNYKKNPLTSPVFSVISPVLKKGREDIIPQCSTRKWVSSVKQSPLKLLNTGRMEKLQTFRNAKVGQGRLSQLIEGYFNIINGLLYFDRDS